MGKDARYDEILRRIQQKRAEEAAKQKTDALAGPLDLLNAMGLLERVKKHPPAGTACFGPKAFASRRADENWVCAAVWHKPRGYALHEILGVLGIWAVEQAEAIEIIVGTKTLHYSAPLYNAESYNYQIRRGFKVYYDGDASPPDELGENHRLYQDTYEIGKRLAMREALEAAVRDWEKRLDSANLL